MSHRFSKLSEFGQSRAKVDVSRRVVRLKAHRFPVARDRLLGFFLPKQGHAEIVVRLGIIRAQP
jgi:hypothetical protein